MTRTRKYSGFTLIEILIVVIILGILAAIVIPQFTNASTEARQSSMASQLQTLRSQIGTYVAQHNGTNPGSQASTTLWGQLTIGTDALGAPNSTASAYGPYFSAAVSNPLMNSSTVVGSSSTPAAGDGWEYNPANGEIHGVATVSEDSTGAPLTTPVLSITDDGVKEATWNSAPAGSGG